MRSNRALHGEQGWATGPALHHYRCLTYYFPRKKIERQVDTVNFFPTVIPFPKVKIEDFLRQDVNAIIKNLTDPPSTTTPSLQAGNPIRNGLL